MINYFRVKLKSHELFIFFIFRLIDNNETPTLKLKEGKKKDASHRSQHREEKLETFEQIMFRSRKFSVSNVESL
jgi:hypothetical protein